MSSKTSSMDDRMKSYEPKEKFMSRLPVVVRLDGRSFSKFTKDLVRPYDMRFAYCMQKVAEYLTKKFNPTLVHTQSDEITMLFDYTETDRDNMMFGGRIFKFESILAAAATGKFVQMMALNLPEKVDIEDEDADLPEFDARAYQLPNKAEATNVFLWRAQDCVRNSVQMLARANFSHSECQNKSTRDLVQMLEVQKNITWANQAPHFKYGSYYRKCVVPVETEHSAEPVLRSRVEHRDYSEMGSIGNREGVIFNDERPLSLEHFNE